MSDGTPHQYYVARLWLSDYGAMPYLFTRCIEFIEPIPVDSSHAATGTTTRLPNVCPACSDGAQFCISCGAQR